MNYDYTGGSFNQLERILSIEGCVDKSLTHNQDNVSNLRCFRKPSEHVDGFVWLSNVVEPRRTAFAEVTCQCRRRLFVLATRWPNVIQARIGLVGMTSLRRWSDKQGPLQNPRSSSKKSGRQRITALRHCFARSGFRRFCGTHEILEPRLFVFKHTRKKEVVKIAACKLR